MEINNTGLPRIAPPKQFKNMFSWKVNMRPENISLLSVLTHVNISPAVYLAIVGILAYMKLKDEREKELERGNKKKESEKGKKDREIHRYKEKDRPKE